MIPSTSNIHHALNDRTTNSLMKYKTDTNAVIGSTGEPTFSDADSSGLLEHGQEVLITVVKNVKQSLVVLSSPIC